MNIRTSLLVSAALLSAAGCFTVKTESEIKPIHITMDVNLKVDKELDKAFADENMKKPQGDFKEIKSLLDRKVAGITSKAMLEARDGATDDDRILIAESNAKKLKRFNEIAKSSGTTQSRRGPRRSSPRRSPPVAASGSSPRTVPGVKNNQNSLFTNSASASFHGGVR